MSNFLMAYEIGHGGEIRLELTPRTFDFTQDTYHFNLSWVGADTGSYTYEVTAPSGHIPCGRISADRNGVIGYIGQLVADSIFNSITGSISNLSNLTINPHLISHTGGNSISMFDGSLGFAGNEVFTSPSVPRTIITIDADFPIFASNLTQADTPQTGQLGEYYYFDNLSDEVYMNEIYGGNFENVDKAANYETLADTIDTARQYFIVSQVKRDGVVTSYKNYRFSILDDAVISLAHDGDYWILHLTELPYKYVDNSQGESSSHNWIESNVLLSEHVNYPYDEDYASGGHQYSVTLYTNIPRFDSEARRQQYEDGEIGEDAALDGGGAYISSPIGDELGVTDIDTSTFDSRASGGTVYILSASDMADIKGYLFDPNKKTVLSEGLWAWGNAPISSVIGLYYVPFNVSDFYNTDSAGVKFGSHIATDLGFKTVATVGGKMKTIFAQSFEGKYGDFRDYEYFDYDLYLPYVGKFIPLDPNKYINKRIVCKAVFDANKHEMRYFLFADSVIQERIDCVVGVELPLISTDNISKAKTDINSRFNEAKNISSAIAGVASSVATGNAVGLVGAFASTFNTAASHMQATMQRNTKPTESITGGYSSSLNTFDIRYPYLRITERLTVKPSNLNAIYNYPSYYIGKASQLSGYCEIDDIQLVTSATEAEIREAKQLLKEGVIF